MEATAGGLAVVVGASGGIGRALAETLESRDRQVLRFSRRSGPPLDLTDEASIERAALCSRPQGELRLLLIASGFLHDADFQPEKSLRHLDPCHMGRAFAVNATGPALILKHFLPLVPRDGRCVIAAISAKVGSIGDNQLGGWISYRASKAALNQIVHTAAIELRRTRPQAICVALHPGTVDTALSAPFARTGLDVRTPEKASADLLRTLDALTPNESGGFFDYHARSLPW